MQIPENPRIGDRIGPDDDRRIIAIIPEYRAQRQEDLNRGFRHGLAWGCLPFCTLCLCLCVAAPVWGLIGFVGGIVAAFLLAR